MLAPEVVLLFLLWLCVKVPGLGTSRLQCEAGASPQPICFLCDASKDRGAGDDDDGSGNRGKKGMRTYYSVDKRLVPRPLQAQTPQAPMGIAHAAVSFSASLSPPFIHGVRPTVQILRRLC